MNKKVEFVDTSNVTKIFFMEATMIRQGKIVTLAFVLGLFIAFATACGNKNNDNAQNTTSSTENATTDKNSKGIIEDVGDGIGNGVKDIGDGIGNGIEDIGDGVQNGINDIGNGGNNGGSVGGTGINGTGNSTTGR